MSPYEIRLTKEGGDPLIFVTLQDADESAWTFARRLLERYGEFDKAEVWSSLRLVCTV